MGPNFEECKNDAKGKKGLIPKSGRHSFPSSQGEKPEKCSRENARRNGNDHSDIKGGCRPNLLECPLVKKYQESLKKGRHQEERSSSGKTSSMGGKSSDKGKRRDDAEKSQSDDRDSRSTCSNAFGNVRSTRAQELRTRSNLDSLTSKSTDISSPYASSILRKKKPNSAESKCFSRRSGQEKKITGTEKLGKIVQRARRKEKFFQREDSHPSATDSGDFVGLKKSTTFFICKGPKQGGGDNNGNASPSPRIVESEDEIFSPRPNPITHNDSFCLIAKSSRNWYRKNRSDDEKLLGYGFGTDENVKSEKSKEEKGILKNCVRDLKSVDSLERIDSEKIVRFSDEQSGKGQVLKKNVRRKRRLQNTVNAAWYRRNKLFQKYLQILKSKSILYAPQDEMSPRGVKSYSSDSPFMRDRYEAEMLGLVPRQGRLPLKNKKKFPIEDDDLE